MKTFNNINTNNTITNTPYSINDLKVKLNKLNMERSDFLLNKSILISKLINVREKGENNHERIIEDIQEIDRGVEALGQVITNSADIAKAIINPVSEREICITNISKTIDLLKIENDIKSLLQKLKNEKNKIESKINIIIEASNLINLNHTVFDSYRGHFLRESQDVLNYLNNTIKESKTKLFANLAAEGKVNFKECNSLLNEIDKNSILTFKLTDDISHIKNFSKIAAEFILQAITKNQLKEFQESTTDNSGNKKHIQVVETISRNFIVKIFLKTASLINEKKVIYYKEFKDFKVFTILIEQILQYLEKSLETMIKIIENISDKILKENNINDLDFICGEKVNIMNNLEKFKFFVFTLLEKLSMIPNNSSLSFNEFFKNFNTLLYDLGEKYANTEIKFMKNKLLVLFKEEAQIFWPMIEKNLNSNYDELAGTTLNCVDDFFFILKISGARSISSLNLQLSLAIINNIKSILTEELFELLDIKISALLFKTDNKYSNYTQEVKYTCKEEVGISYKFTPANLFLISCLNAVDQCRNNILLLFEELKSSIENEILHSQAFNHRDIILGVEPDLEEKMNEKINYFKRNETDLINITFSEVDYIIKKYDEFIHRKLKLSFEFLYPNIKSSVDILNSAIYIIDGRNIQNVELSESFSGKFIEETDKILKQWKTQLSENCFNSFLSIYTEYVSLYLEKLMMMKNYSSYGSIVLEKDINKIVNYFQSKVTISIREKFNRLTSIVKVLNFESREELVDHIRKYDDIKLSRLEIEAITKLKKDN